MGRRWTSRDIAEFRRRRAASRDPVQDPQPERDEQTPLVGTEFVTPRLVHIAGPVVVRIVRRGPRRLDDDNLSGGCKELRDAIAVVLGRKGDSERDGLRFEYSQERGPSETIIEVRHGS